MPGSFDAEVDGAVDKKTCPYAIVAQPVTGRYEIECEGRTELIETGEVFMVGPNQPMRIVHHGDPAQGGRMAARWLHFHFTIYDSLDFTMLYEVPLRGGLQAGQQFGAIIAEYLKGVPDASPEGFDRLIHRKELAYRALRLFCSLSRPRGDWRERLHATRSFQPVITFIREHLGEKLDVETLARQAGLSVSRFHVLFQRQIFCSPMEYVKNARLGYAGRLLVSTDTPLYEIAEKAGFSHQFHFSREFKKRFGMPPSEFRRAHPFSASVEK